jgi:P27 family predicted phage terminase small subunit
MRGRKPRPGAMGRSRAGEAEPIPPKALPRCPDHLSKVARKEWRRLATPLYRMGVLSVTDRAALAAYCQAWARWVEAEEHLAKGPSLIKTPSGYVQQSPWLTVANKQLEIMGRFMAELGLSPSARTRLRLPESGADDSTSIKIITLIAAENEGESKTDRLPVNVRVSES